MRYPRDYDPVDRAYDALPYVRFDPATGAISEWGIVARMYLDTWIEDEGQPVLIGSGEAATHYVDLASKTLRRKHEGFAVQTGAVLSNLPRPCTVVIDSFTRYEVTDGTADLTGSDPGIYTVEIESVDTLTQTFTVTV